MKVCSFPMYCMFGKKNMNCVKSSTNFKPISNVLIDQTSNCCAMSEMFTSHRNSSNPIPSSYHKTNNFLSMSKPLLRLLSVIQYNQSIQYAYAYFSVQ